MSREHEEGLVAFITPQFRARFRQLIGEPGGGLLCYQLDHFDHHLDARYAKEIEMHVKQHLFLEQVHELLVAAGAGPTCFAFTTELDYGSEHPLQDAVSSWSTAPDSSCRPAKLGLYVSEEGLMV